jgi:hypothetical protein
MTQAASPFLNQPLRDERHARADDDRSMADQDRAERQRRLTDHGATFCRMILDGAFERIYRADGSYVLQQVGGEPLESDSRVDESPPAIPESQDCVPQKAKRAEPSAERQILYRGYAAALRDLSSWVSTAALDARMDAATLAALNGELARLAHSTEGPPLGERRI